MLLVGGGLSKARANAACVQTVKAEDRGWQVCHGRNAVLGILP